MSKHPKTLPDVPWHKRLEIAGRHFLVWLLGLLFRSRNQPVTLGESPRILVVRLDERLGNLVMLMPLLASLKARYPTATIELLASPKHQEFLLLQPLISELLIFNKRKLLAYDGPFRTPRRLRKRHYDLAMDATNPTDPSATQAVLVRLSGARHTVGFDTADFGRLFSCPVKSPSEPLHEIDLRLALLDPLPGEARVRIPTLAAVAMPTPNSAIGRFLQDEVFFQKVVLINLGARLEAKRLSGEDYAAIANVVHEKGFAVCLAYGPSEEQFAKYVTTLCPYTKLAPPTSVLELAALMTASCAVISCDTGPMHLAVGLGKPTCGIFVCTEPWRYGYGVLPHTIIDARIGTVQKWLPDIAAWVFNALRRCP